ncbi:LysR substrate-binding domain-containing protein [Aestuariivirga sp.]|uniref:LysR substrate-binding domain-containing protein n=1 Tax=Aestuariivirga sp. TaxID=2650926 RepID=UPI0039E37676
MTDHLPWLPWLRSFEAAARRLNFTLAGEELGLTQAAISQQVKALEQALGKSLFRRGRRGVELTSEGAAYLPHVQAAFASLSQTTGELFGGTAGTEISLITPASFGALWLAPRLPAFTTALPGVALAISTMTAPGDYAAASADLEIRFGAGQWPGLQTHRLTTEYMTPLCAPSLDAANWSELPLLTVRGAREMWHDWFRMAGMTVRLRRFHSFDTFAVALEAAKAGAGVLLGSRPLVDAAIRKGELLRLSSLDLPSPNGHFLGYRAGEALSPAARAAVDWLLREAAQTADHPAV